MSPDDRCGRSLIFHGRSGDGLYGVEETHSPPVRLHRSHEGDDAASLRRVAPSFLFIQATLRNVAALICSRLSDASGAGGGRGENSFSFPNRQKRLCAAFGGQKRLPTYIVGHSLRKREEPKRRRLSHPVVPAWCVGVYSFAYRISPSAMADSWARFSSLMEPRMRTVSSSTVTFLQGARSSRMTLAAMGAQEPLSIRATVRFW